MALPSSRYFRMVERLPLRGGAVTHALAAKEAAEGPAEPAARALVTPPTSDTDGAIMASLSDHPGFPGIEYAGG